MEVVRNTWDKNSDMSDFIDVKRNRKIILKTFRVLLITAIILGSLGTFMFLLSFHLKGVITKYLSMGMGLVTLFVGAASFIRCIRVFMPGGRNLKHIIDGKGDVVWFYSGDSKTNTGSFFRIVYTWDKQGRNNNFICDTEDTDYLLDHLMTQYPGAKKGNTDGDYERYKENPTVFNSK